MTALAAAAHIGGALFAFIALGVAVLLVGAWESNKIQQHRRQSVAVQLGVPAEDLEAEELAPRLMQLLAERSSPELLRNRLADLCGAVRTLWSWSGGLLQWGILAGTVWFTIAEANSNAVFAWAAVATAVLFLVASALFSYACLLFTGRFPGEPKVARKVLSDYYNTRKAAS